MHFQRSKYCNAACSGNRLDYCGGTGEVSFYNSDWNQQISRYAQTTGLTYGKQFFSYRQQQVYILYIAWYVPLVLDIPLCSVGGEVILTTKTHDTMVSCVMIAVHDVRHITWLSQLSLVAIMSPWLGFHAILLGGVRQFGTLGFQSFEIGILGFHPCWNWDFNIATSPGRSCHLYGKVGNNCKRISDSGTHIYEPSLVTF